MPAVRALVFFSIALCAGCAIPAGDGGEGRSAEPFELISEVSSRLDEHEEVDSPWHVAPFGVIDDEVFIEGELRAVTLGADPQWGTPVRVDARAREHLAFRLDFVPTRAAVDMEVLTWDGEAPRSLGKTDWGRGFRLLSAFAPFGERTFWVRARSREGVTSGTLTVDMTAFEHGPACETSCDELIQLPLPVDSEAQGYEMAELSVYAYQYGRRDLMVALLYTGEKLARAGMPPFAVKRLSRWDGGQPPSHRSHFDGVDVDISLYTEAGEAVFHPLCINAGRRCRAHTRRNFGAEAMTMLFAGFFESGLFDRREDAVIFLDREYWPALRRAAERLHGQERLDDKVFSLFSTKRRIFRHVEPHHHHVHIRVRNSEREEAGGGQQNCRSADCLL